MAVGKGSTTGGGSQRRFDPASFRILIIGRYLVTSGRILPATFVAISLFNLAGLPSSLGVDARIYARAAHAWLSGGSPWDAFVLSSTGSPLHFGALPPTVITFVPFALIPEGLAVWIWLFASILAAAYIIRQLGLRWWWVFFPPLVQGVFVANPQIVLLALLLSSSSLVASLAPVLKIYAVAPLVGDRRVSALFLTSALFLASYLVAPSLWQEYVSRSGDIATRLLHEAIGGYSAFFVAPGLVAFTLAGVAALALVDLRAAGWLVAPALVPASQFHLSTMAMPVLAKQGSFLMVLLLALPVRGLPALVIALYGFWRLGTTLWRRESIGTVDAVRRSRIASRR